MQHFNKLTSDNYDTIAKRRLIGVVEDFKKVYGKKNTNKSNLYPKSRLSVVFMHNINNYL